MTDFIRENSSQLLHYMNLPCLTSGYFILSYFPRLNYVFYKFCNYLYCHFDLCHVSEFNDIIAYIALQKQPVLCGGLSLWGYPVIADLFHRMKYMKRRGSGLRKIVSETEKLPGYSEIYKPEFFSTATDFRVILKNVNYHLSQKDLVSDQDCDQVSDQDRSQDILHAVLDFCITEKSKQEICSFIGYRNFTYFTRKYLNPLLASGQLKMTIPDKPNSRKQKYITVHSE